MFGLFKKSEPTVIGIDIGSSAIKIVELSKKDDRAVLDTYGALALGPYAGTEIGRATQLPPEKIVEALNNLLKESKTKTRKAGLAVPVSSTLMSLIELPAVSEAELATMVPLEARKYIPVPISEVTLNWSVIPKNEVNQDQGPGVPIKDESFETQFQPPVKTAKQDVLIVAIHNDILAKYQTIIEKAKLDVSFFEVELFSTMRSIADEETAPIMVVDIGAAFTKLYIVERGVMRVSHTINRGSQDITLAIAKSLSITVDKAEMLKRQQGLLKTVGGPQISEVTALILDYIFSEANRILVAHQRKSERSLRKVFLVGGGSALPGIIDFARAHFQTDIFLGDPFSKVETPAFLVDVLKNTGPEFAVAVGLALRRLQEL